MFIQVNAPERPTSYQLNLNNVIDTACHAISVAKTSLWISRIQACRGPIRSQQININSSLKVMRCNSCRIYQLSAASRCLLTYGAYPTYTAHFRHTLLSDEASPLNYVWHEITFHHQSELKQMICFTSTFSSTRDWITYL